MKSISDIQNEYQGRLDQFDLELLIAHAIGKSREFIITHPEFKLDRSYELRVTSYASRRIANEPLSYITGHKEFYGLEFEVNKYTLIPRPETELLVEQAIQVASSKLQVPSSNIFIVDVGTGSGNIIISIVKEIEVFSHQSSVIKFFGLDASKEALKVSRRNAKKHKLDKKIKFLHGNLLDPLAKCLKAKKLKTEKLIILANLPYLSKEVFESSQDDVRMFEPKSALYSPEQGLSHYRKLFIQIQNLLVTNYELQVTVLIEFSPEQKNPLQNLIEENFPTSKTNFQKDLAGKWRIARVEI